MKNIMTIIFRHRKPSYCVLSLFVRRTTQVLSRRADEWRWFTDCTYLSKRNTAFLLLGRSCNLFLFAVAIVKLFICLTFSYIKSSDFIQILFFLLL